MGVLIQMVRLPAAAETRDAQLLEAERLRIASAAAFATPRDPTDTAFALLSDRQRQVVGLTADGLSTKEIAGRLGVSVKTAETHRAAAMDRLQLYSVAELTKYAVLAGLSPLGASVVDATSPPACRTTAQTVTDRATCADSPPPFPSVAT